MLTSLRHYIQVSIFRDVVNSVFRVTNYGKYGFYYEKFDEHSLPDVGFRTAVNNHSYDVRCAPFLTSIHVGASPLHPTFPLGTLPEKDKPAPVH